MMPRDIRRPPNGERVTAVFFMLSDKGTWEVYGPIREIQPRQPSVDSLPVEKGIRTLAAIIYWDDKPQFKSEPMLCAPGDSFTFNFGEGNGSRE